ncbi:hypothetical protein FACS1894207_2940 [Bacteroidia bacterium]|nr:hypothetical protein FACS1894207_2940 [Bacteroidia bacterium]
MNKSKIIRIIAIIFAVIAISSFVIARYSYSIGIIADYCSIISAILSVISNIVNIIIDKYEDIEMDWKKIFYVIVIFVFIIFVLNVGHFFQAYVTVQPENGDKSSFRFHAPKNDIEFHTKGDTIFIYSHFYADGMNWEIYNGPRGRDTIFVGKDTIYWTLGNIKNRNVFRNVIIEDIDYTWGFK